MMLPTNGALDITKPCHLSRYLLHRMLAEEGFPLERVAVAVRALLGPDPDPDQLPGEEVPLDPETGEWEPAPEPAGPTPEDWADFHAWCREQDARRQDEEDAHRHAEWIQMMEAEHRFTDQDLMAAGLPVG